MTERWGRYQLERLVAKGGMAEIFSAVPVSHRNGERVCIKRIRPEFSDDPEFAAMFRQEAKIASAISHENVVRVFEFDQREGQLFIAMEFVDGLDLKQVLHTSGARGLPIPLGFSVHVVRGLLRALVAAASVHVDGVRGAVVHRDISPHNLLVSRTGAVKLTDFGIAKARGSSTVTRTGVIKGKLAYLSPEQASGEGVTPRSDLYGVGLVLFELLAGRRYHAGRSEAELLANVLGDGDFRVPWLSEELNGFLGSLLARRADDRFQNAAQALDALESLTVPPFGADAAAAYLNHLGFASEASGNGESTGRTSQDNIPMPQPSRPRWRLAMVPLLLLFVLAGVVLAASFPWDSIGEAPPAPPVATDVEKRPDAHREQVVVRLDTPATSSIPEQMAAAGDASPEVTPRKRPEVKKPGTLQVHCRPWAHVRVDGKEIGTTPVTGLSLPAGPHRLELVNEALGFHKKRSVVISPGKTTRIIEQVTE